MSVSPTAYFITYTLLNAALRLCCFAFVSVLPSMHIWKANADKQDLNSTPSPCPFKWCKKHPNVMQCHEACPLSCCRTPVLPLAFPCSWSHQLLFFPVGIISIHWTYV